MRKAKEYAAFSPCVRAQVGAVLTKPNPQDLTDVLAYGYNTNASGTCEFENGVTKPDTDHAECVLLRKIGRLNIDGYWLYVTRRPCIYCSTEIIGRRISKVFYVPEGNNYGIDFLIGHGVECFPVELKDDYSKIESN